ncbi:hypothetical protein [Paenibacillus massiliensis]|nr:hypothetical protein [Paenibacillus massiliensis]
MEDNVEYDHLTVSNETVRTEWIGFRHHSMFHTNNECNERKTGQDGSLEA